MLILDLDYLLSDDDREVVRAALRAEDDGVLVSLVLTRFWERFDESRIAEYEDRVKP